MSAHTIQFILNASSVFIVAVSASFVGGEIKSPIGEIMDVQFFTPEQIKEMKDKFVGGWVYTTILRHD